MQLQNTYLNSTHYLSLTTLAALLLSIFISPPLKAEVVMPPMDGVYMQNMMIKMNQMQDCLSDIDPEKYHQAEQAMYQAHAEISTFCQTHQQVLAQQEAIRFSKLLQESETLTQIKRCSQPMRGLMPTMPLMGQTSDILSKQNICDVMTKP